MSKNSKYRKNQEAYEEQVVIPKKHISKEEQRRLKRLKNAMRTKSLHDLMDLDEELS
jgi:hypothetical protein